MDGKPIKHKPRTNSVLTREEYLRLLLTARDTGRYRLYLLIKLFTFADISIHSLRAITVEAIKEGAIPGRHGQRFTCPEFFQKELLDYAKSKSIRNGPIFVTCSGELLDRSNIHHELTALSKYALVPAEKVSMRTLHDLYQCTQESISEQINAMTQAAYDQLLIAEQNIVGWNNTEIPG